MTYYIEAVERDVLPVGRDWMFVEEPNGNQHFVVANDAQVVLPADALCGIINRVAEGNDLSLRVAS